MIMVGFFFVPTLTFQFTLFKNEYFFFEL